MTSIPLSVSLMQSGDRESPSLEVSLTCCPPPPPRAWYSYQWTDDDCERAREWIQNTFPARHGVQICNPGVLRDPFSRDMRELVLTLKASARKWAEIRECCDATNGKLTKGRMLDDLTKFGFSDVRFACEEERVRKLAEAVERLTKENAQLRAELRPPAK